MTPSTLIRNPLPVPTMGDRVDLRHRTSWQSPTQPQSPALARIVANLRMTLENPKQQSSTQSSPQKSSSVSSPQKQQSQQSAVLAMYEDNARRLWFIYIALIFLATALLTSTLVQLPAAGSVYFSTSEFTAYNVHVPNNPGAFACICVGLALLGAAARGVLEAELWFHHARCALQPWKTIVRIGTLLWWSLFAFIAVGAFVGNAMFATSMILGAVFCEVLLSSVECCGGGNPQSQSQSMTETSV